MIAVCVVVSVQPSDSGLTVNTRFILLAYGSHLVKAAHVISTHTPSAL